MPINFPQKTVGYRWVNLTVVSPPSLNDRVQFFHHVLKRVPWPSPKTSGLGTLLSHFGLQLTVRQDSQLHVTACRLASQGFDRKTSLPNRLLATEQLGLYSDRTLTGKLCLAWLGAQVLDCRCFIKTLNTREWYE